MSPLSLGLTCCFLQATCDAELKKETEQHPELADLDDVGSSVGDE